MKKFVYQKRKLFKSRIYQSITGSAGVIMCVATSMLLEGQINFWLLSAMTFLAIIFIVIMWLCCNAQEAKDKKVLSQKLEQKSKK